MPTPNSELVSSNSATNHGESTPLLNGDWNGAGGKVLSRRQIRRTTALAIAMISAGVILVMAVIIQAAFTNLTKSYAISEETDDDGPVTQSFSVRVLFLFVFAGGLGVNSVIAGIRIMRIVSLEGNSIERELSWAGIDVHGLSTGGIFLSIITAIAAVIAVVSFQSFNSDSGGEFQFNITESIGWMVIGCIALVMIGLFSTTELEARALLGKLIQTHTARSRAIALTQLVFAIQTFLVGLPLLFTNLPINALLITGGLFTFGASFLALIASGLVLKQLTFVKWPADVNFLVLDRSWGTSAGSHCLALLACGIHIFFAIEGIYNCNEKDTTDYRPNCDANIGSLTAVLPFLFNILSLALLGIASIVAAVRMGSLSREYSHGEFNASDELIHTSDFVSAQSSNNGSFSDLMASNALKNMTPSDLKHLFNSAVPNSGDMIETAKIDGKVLCMMLSAAPAPWTTCAQTVEILSEIAHIQLTRVTTAHLLSAIHDVFVNDGK